MDKSKLSFFAELQRRNVHRAAVFYAGAAWLLVQIATQVFPFFDIPNSVVRIVVIACVLGFPFAMIFSWFYEWTPQGIKLEREIDRSASITRATGKKLDKAIIAVLIVAVVLLLANTLMPREAKQLAGDDRSIAVLPFTNTSGDAGNEYFSDGLSEELISSLSRLSQLKVVGRNSSFRFKNDTGDSKTIGEKLGVTYLLEGSVRKSSDRVRIAVALVKAANGLNVWSDSYDRELNDIFAVQSEIATAVAGQLKVALLGDNAQAVQAPSAAAPSNHNIEAYTALLQGNFHANRQTQDDYVKAIAFYDEALRLDPGYALAYARLSVAWTDLSTIWLGGQAARDGMAKSRAAAQTATRLAPDSSDALLALGDLLMEYDFDLPAAEAVYRRAIAVAPSEAVLKLRLAYTLGARGQIDEALQLMREGLQLDPLQTEGYVFYSRALLGLGRLDEAEAAARKGLELQPGTARLHVVLTQIEMLRHRLDLALAQAREEPQGFWRDYALALVAQGQGDAVAADATLQGFIARYRDNAPAQIGILYALRQDPDRMFEWLERGLAARDTGVIFLPRNDPFLLAYRDDPRFIAFCKKAGLVPAA